MYIGFFFSQILIQVHKVYRNYWHLTLNAWMGKSFFNSGKLMQMMKMVSTIILMEFHWYKKYVFPWFYTCTKSLP